MREREVEKECSICSARLLLTLNLFPDKFPDQSAYWADFLVTAGNIYTDKIGKPQISLTLSSSERDRKLLIKLTNFLRCNDQIPLKSTKANGKVRSHYTLRFSSRIAEKL